MRVVVRTGRISQERVKTNCVVIAAGRILKERLIADSRVVACLVITHRLKTDGGVVVAGEVIS